MPAALGCVTLRTISSPDQPRAKYGVWAPFGVEEREGSVPARCLPHRGADRPLARAGWWSDAPPQQQCVRAFVSLRRSAKCQCSCVCVCCVCVLPMSSATPPHQGTLLSRHCSTGLLKVVTRVQHIPRRPTLVAGDCGVGRVSSTVPEALPHVCQGAPDGGSAWQQWPVLFRCSVHLPAPARWRWVGAGTCSPLGRSALVCVARIC